MEQYIIDIEVDKKQRDKHIKRIKNYLDKKHKPKALKYIRYFLEAELSCRFLYEINLAGKLRALYCDNFKHYSPFTIRLYFPKKNLCICCSQDYAESISIVSAILSKNYEEEAISFRYYNEYINKICHSGKLIILMIEPNAIILNNGKDLETFLQESIRN